MPGSIVGFYQQNYPDLYIKRSQDINQAAQAVLAIYNRNVFPDLRVTWGTYPNNLGHTDFPGCFRCHDGSHTTADGKSITLHRTPVLVTSHWRWKRSRPIF